MEMAADAGPGADWQYLGTASDPTSRDGATFVIDPGIDAQWPTDSVGAWPTIHSPLVGADIGANPHMLP